MRVAGIQVLEPSFAASQGTHLQEARSEVDQKWSWDVMPAPACGMRAFQPVSQLLCQMAVSWQDFFFLLLFFFCISSHEWILNFTESFSIPIEMIIWLLSFCWCDVLYFLNVYDEPSLHPLDTFHMFGMNSLLDVLLGRICFCLFCFLHLCSLES